MSVTCLYTYLLTKIFRDNESFKLDNFQDILFLFTHILLNVHLPNCKVVLQTKIDVVL